MAVMLLVTVPVSLKGHTKSSPTCLSVSDESAFKETLTWMDTVSSQSLVPEAAMSPAIRPGRSSAYRSRKERIPIRQTLYLHAFNSAFRSSDRNHDLELSLTSCRSMPHGIILIARTRGPTQVGVRFYA